MGYREKANHESESVGKSRVVAEVALIPVSTPVL